MSRQVDEAIAEFRAFQARPAPSEPEIRVNDVVITAEAVRREAQNHPALDPKAALEAAARALVVRELLLQEARRLRLAVSPAQDAKGRSETEEDALISVLLDMELHVPKADEASCRRYFENNRRRFRSPDLYEARHILLAAAADDGMAREQARGLAERLIGMLTAEPGRFSELASTHSACPSRNQGGNLGQLASGQTVPEFETFLFNLEQGQLCPVPVPTRFGFHVVRLDRKIAGRPIEFDMVRQKVADYLEAASWSRAVAQYVAILAGAARIEGITLTAADSPLVQ